MWVQLLDRDERLKFNRNCTSNNSAGLKRNMMEMDCVKKTTFNSSRINKVLFRNSLKFIWNFNEDNQLDWSLPGSTWTRGRGQSTFVDEKINLEIHWSLPGSTWTKERGKSTFVDEKINFEIDWILPGSIWTKEQGHSTFVDVKINFDQLDQLTRTINLRGWKN